MGTREEKGSPSSEESYIAFEAPPNFLSRCCFSFIQGLFHPALKDDNSQIAKLYPTLDPLPPLALDSWLNHTLPSSPLPGTQPILQPRCKLDESSVRECLRPGERASTLRQHFEAQYNVARKKERGGRTLWVLFVRLQRGLLAQQFILATIDLAMRLATALLLREFVAWRGEKGYQSEAWWGYVISTLLAISVVLQAFSFQHTMDKGACINLRTRAHIILGMQAKVLRLTKLAVQRLGMGDVLDILANDTRRLEETAPFWPYLILGPLSLGVVFVMILYEMGPLPAMAGCGALLLILPTQAVFARHHGHTRLLLSSAAGRRFRMINEFVHGAQPIKVNGLEQPFLQRAEAARKEENHLLHERSIIKAIAFSSIMSAIPLATCATFVVAWSLHDKLTLSSVFYVVVLVDIPRDMLAVYFLRALEATAELHVGFQRVDRFLRQPEAPLMGVAQAPGGGDGAEPNMDEGGRELPLVEVHGSYAWPVSDSDASRLKPHAHHGHHGKPTIRTLKSYKSVKRPRSVAHLGKYATAGHERQSGGTLIYKDEARSPPRPPPSPPPPDSEPAEGMGKGPAPPEDQAGPASSSANEVTYHSNPAFIRPEMGGSSGGGSAPLGDSIPGQPGPSPSPGLSAPPPALLSASSTLRSQLNGAGGLPPVEPSPSRKKIILQPLEAGSAGSPLPNQPLGTVADSTNENAATSISNGSMPDSAARQARPRPAARFMEIPEDSVSGQAGPEASAASIPGDVSSSTPSGKPNPARPALRFSVDSGLGSNSGGRAGPRLARFDEPASDPEGPPPRGTESRTSGPGPRFAGAQVAPSSSEPSQDQSSSYMKPPALGGPSFLRKHNQVTPAADVAARAEGKPAGHVVGFQDAHAVDHSKPSTAPEAPPSVAVKNVSLKFRRGELVAVVGTVGSGKSSLLSVILGEVPAVPGSSSSVILRSQVAYVSQAYWLLTGTIKDNVCFGLPYDEEKFQKTMKGVALDDDLALMPQGPDTCIGDGGKSLSQGQRAQLSLARAVYSNADVIVVDNILSNLDPDTVNTVFNEALYRLARGRTRIVVTTDLSILKYFDRVIVMRDGAVVADARYERCCSLGIPEVLDPEELLPVEEDEDTDGMESDGVWSEDEEEEGEGDLATVVPRLSGPKEGSSAKDLNGRRRSDRASRATTSPGDSLRGGKALGADGSMKGGMNSSRRLISTGSGAMGNGKAPPRPSKGASSMNLLGLTRNYSEAEHPPKPLVITASGHVRSTMAHLTPREKWRKAVRIIAQRNVLGMAVRHEQKQKLKKTGIQPEDLEIAEIATAMSLIRQDVPKDDVKQHVPVHRICYDYLSHMGRVNLAIVAALMVLGQAAEMVQHVWLALWAKLKHKDDQHKVMYPLVLGLLTAAVLVLAIGRTMHYFIMTDIASTRVCQLFTWKILRAPLSFFHATPSGQILNRASRDQSQIDDLMPGIILDLVANVLIVIGSLVYATWALYYTALAILPLLAIFFFMWHYFRALARDSNRFESTTLSPVLNSFGNSLTGVTIIRAYGLSNTVLSKLEDLMDLNSSWLKISRANARWLGLNVDILSAVLIGFFTHITVATDRSSGSSHGTKGAATDAKLTALALSQILALTDALRWLVKLLIEVEQVSVSAERVLEYTHLPEDYPLEADMPPDAQKPPASWPQSGLVRFRNVVARYREGLPAALRNVTFTIHPGLTTGFAGQTGSGKSSVLMALCRTILVSSGQIYLDGLDISKIGIDTLKARIAVIPQEPLIFTGTFRRNLDPWGKVDSDDTFWRVLEDLRLKDFIIRSGGLDANLEAETSGMSVGHRQLLCLARALIRQDSVVLCMDEAASAVDSETDAIMKRALKTACGAVGIAGTCQKSVLVIAHHLDTLYACDNLVVLEVGRVVETGPTGDLRLKEDGAFQKMIQAHDKKIEGKMIRALTRKGGSQRVPLGR